MKIYKTKNNIITYVLVAIFYIIIITMYYILINTILKEYFSVGHSILLILIASVGLIVAIYQQINLYKSYLKIENEMIYIHQRIEDVQIYYKDIIWIKYTSFLDLSIFSSITIYCKEYYKRIDCYRENYLDMLYNIVENCGKYNANLESSGKDDPKIQIDERLFKVLEKKGYLNGEPLPKE